MLEGRSPDRPGWRNADPTHPVAFRLAQGPELADGLRATPLYRGSRSPLASWRVQLLLDCEPYCHRRTPAQRELGPPQSRGSLLVEIPSREGCPKGGVCWGCTPQM